MDEEGFWLACGVGALIVAAGFGCLSFGLPWEVSDSV